MRSQRFTERLRELAKNDTSIEKIIEFLDEGDIANEENCERLLAFNLEVNAEDIYRGILDAKQQQEDEEVFIPSSCVGNIGSN